MPVLLDAGRIAGLQFPEYNITLYGTARQFNPVEFSVKLQSMPDSKDAFAPGNRANVLFVSNRSIYIAEAHVVSERNGILDLEFQAPLRRVQHRSGYRKPCTLPVRFRALHSEDRFGLWHIGETVDVSIGGMCLQCENDIDVPCRVEMCLLLPNSSAPVKTTARVAHSQHNADGKTEIGHSFYSTN